ncbi:NAD-dependent epimerase/dehydratase family protein [Paenibacillus sp. FSL L8-0436]|uniref:NAD-dependent epimerase/dehydratase family protein n=1 Tax=Paenibacillus sp. FSL L8-0436 TaxID=2954686 RepID=UPI0031595FC9
MEKKKILITGKGSYIGTNFIKWLQKWPSLYETFELSVRDDEWKKHDFSFYNIVVHVAGIAHVSADPNLEQQYYKINRDLAIEVANKAKKENVGQFIFLSSMIVYGTDGTIGKENIITNSTIPTPSDFYGKSKLEADLAIQRLGNEKFNVVSVRTPMVYGPNCKGNFPKLNKLTDKTFIFPDIKNQRSMIFINNLCQFLKLIVDEKVTGVFHPQNKDYVCTTEIIKIMASIKNKRIFYFKILNPILLVISRKNNFINKVFGNKVYEKSLSCYPNWNYNIVDFRNSIEQSIRRGE